MKITIHTDGAASGNPGPGGYGAVLESGKHRKEIWGGYRMTTNNRMELLAVIAALEALKSPGMDVTVVSDSKYVVDAVEKGWLFGWEKEGERVLRTERYFGQVSRSFQLGQDVEESRSSAKFADGVLELTLPKKLAPQAKRLVID